MRVLHLGFQLDCPFGEAAKFREKDANVFQPFLAFLERNVQKYPEFRVSLQVSGAWLEQAERYDIELIARLKKLAERGKIDFLATPYYNSLAFFYDKAEFEAEMWLHKEKIHDLFGVSCPVCAFPDLMFNDELARAAEKLGYFGILAGGLPETKVRRYENRVYDVASCRQMRVLWRNTELSELLMHDFGTLRPELSVADFQKRLELAAMRGGAMTVFLDVETFARWRSAKISKFLDNFLAEWLKESGGAARKLATATDLATARGVEEEISLKKTVCWRGERTDSCRVELGLVRLSEIENRPPVGLDGVEQRRVLTELYALKPEVFRTEDEDLITEFCALTALDRIYAMSDDVELRRTVLSEMRKMPQDVVVETRAKMDEIRTRMAEIWREKQAEIERREVVVVQKKKPEPSVEVAEEADVDTEEPVAVMVKFDGAKQKEYESATKTVEKVKSVLVEQVEAKADAEDYEVEVEITQKEKPVRRILKKIVIE